MEKTITEVEDEVVEDFSVFEGEDGSLRYEYLIDLGKKMPPYPLEYKTDDFLVKGCQSKVWLHATQIDEHVYFQADSNSPIVKGIISLLVKVLSGQSAVDIVNAKLEFIEAINLRSHLVSNRSNGLTSMIQKMKAYAALYSNQ